MSEPTQVRTGVLAVEEAAVRRRAGLLRVMADSFLRNRTALFGVVVISVFTLAAMAAPVLTEEGTGLAMCKIQSRPWHHVAGWLAAPCYQDYDALLQPPSVSHLIGTDSLGRDNLSRVIYGGRVSLQVGLLATAVAAIVGITMGLASGYFGRWTDSILMRIVDAILAFPGLLLAILMVAVLGPSLRNAMLAIGIGFIPSFARITRANALSIREKEYVESARALGAGPWRIMFRTILPNTMSPIIVQASLVMSYAILIEASLSYLGLGIQPPTPSWGYMLTAGREFITLAWWLTTFPGLAIFLIVLSWNFVGDGIREALDPRQQRR